MLGTENLDNMLGGLAPQVYAATLAFILSKRCPSAIICRGCSKFAVSAAKR